MHMGLLPKKLNELVMTTEEGRVLLRDVRRRRKIIMTNAMFPEHRPELNATESDIENQGRLVCRWKMSCTDAQRSRHLAVSGKRHPYIYKGTVQRLLEAEADEKFGVPDLALRHTWRELWNHGPPPAASKGPPKKYTFGDAFCGGGGMSTGAQGAGFFNHWSFDRDEDAIKTYKLRFPEAQAHKQPVHNFLAEKTDLQVDVMHLSPPCQPHSPAHTTVGKDDEENEASGLAISALLRKIRPRYATLEQTFGLVNRPEWFAAVIASFTSEGFSVKWDVLFCEQYGVPQTRKRLFILAAW
jgi:DNA (cytosine-5)-methyltransferase 1